MCRDIQMSAFFSSVTHTQIHHHRASSSCGSSTHHHHGGGGERRHHHRHDARCTMHTLNKEGDCARLIVLSPFILFGGGLAYADRLSTRACRLGQGKERDHQKSFTCLARSPFSLYIQRILQNTYSFIYLSRGNVAVPPRYYYIPFREY